MVPETATETARYPGKSRFDSHTSEPRIRQLGSYQGQDVSPKYAHRHGFDVGRTLRLPATSTTAIRRVLPIGTE